MTSSNRERVLAQGRRNGGRRQAARRVRRDARARRLQDHADDPTRVAGWTLVDSSQRHPILVYAGADDRCHSHRRAARTV